MRYRFCTLFVAVLLSAQPSDPTAAAKRARDFLLEGKYAELGQMMTPEMQTSYCNPNAGCNSIEPALAKLGAQVKGFGALNGIDEPAVQKMGPNTVVVFPAHFEKQNINFRYIINAQGKVSGMFLLPGEAAWQRPAYSKPDSFRDRAVTIGDDEWKLPGTLSVPVGNGPFPAVVLVHDSGANDRDETKGGTRVLRDLAEGLASRGIVTLRYEKRTRQYAAKTAGLQGMTIEDEIVEDAVRAAALLREQKEVDPKRVYVVAHGLGGYASPRIGEQDGKLAGIAILTANARPLEDVIVSEAEAVGMPAKQLENLKIAAARIKALEQADGDAPPLLGMPATYLLDLKTYDPVAAARKLTVPLFFVQGERDFQVTSKDFALWKTGLAARKDVVFKSYPALNHFMVAGEGKSTEAEYRKPAHVAPEVIDDIAKWIGK